MTAFPVYCNTAAFGLIDPSVKGQADVFYTRLAREGSMASESWRAETEPMIRQTMARFLNAQVADIALLPNFSWGLNAVVQSLGGSERVLLYRGDFPSLLEPFRLNRFPIRWVEAADDFTLPLEEIYRLIRNREVDLVALSQVQYNSGYALPLAEIGALCREHEVTFLVDATQSLGALPVDVTELPVDVLIASHYKWMHAGFGTGVLYLRPGFLEQYPPVVGGFNSMSLQEGEWRHIPSARSYEPGHPNMYGLTLLQAAVLLLEQKGLPEIVEHNRQLTQWFLEGIRDLGLPLIGPDSMTFRSSILLFRDEDSLFQRIREGGFVVTGRAGRVRISLGQDNTMEEVQALVTLLQKGAG